jgi:DNA-binding HxlR family transcriptional regulator
MPEPRSAPARSAGPGPTGPGAGALADALERVGDRWTLLVVAALMGGPRRFGDLLADLEGLAPNILSKRLSRLEAEGLVVGEPYSRRPVRHAYRLTASGAELAGALRVLAHWGASQQRGRTPRAADDQDHDLVHAACGTPVEARWFCPTCDRLVDDPGSEGLRWV